MFLTEVEPDPNFYKLKSDNLKMASPSGIEPPTLRLGGECSILLSYGDIYTHVTSRCLF